MSKHPATATFGEFARIAGYKRPYITQLRKEGRLVLDDKNRVKVAESLARIEATRDPSRDGVRRRHAAARAQAATTASQGGGQDASAPETADDDDEPMPPSAAASPEERNFHASRARKVHFEALRAEDEWRKRNGELMEAADVTAAVTKATTELRARLERLPSVLSPQLAAESDETAIRSLLTDYLEEAQQDMAHALRELSKETNP